MSYAGDNWTKIGPAVHPADGQGGVVYLTPVGIEVIDCLGTIRRLPRNWRDQQPEQASGIAHLSQILSE